MHSTGDDATIQTIFLNQLRHKLPESISFADELAELLHISRDSAYRRIRGETVLSLDEVKKIHNQYGLSLDTILSPDSNLVLINHQSVDSHYPLSQWLRLLIKNLELAKSAKELDLIFAAKDIPIFRYFGIPELATFKLFIWLKAVVKDAHYERLLYTEDVLPKEILAEAARAYHIYASIPSTEIWSDEVIHATLKQIEFCYECSYFAQRDLAAQLCGHLLELVHHIKQEAAEGKKADGGSFRLYYNEILIPDNTIFVNMDAQRMVYINYNMMDFLSTNQASFCEKTEDYMDNLIKNSVLISTIAEKERNRFFNKVEEKIITARKRITG